MSPSVLHEKALQCVANYKRCEKDLIDILSEIDRSKSYLALGVSTLFRYCVEKLGLSESETYRFSQVTRKSYEVPELKEAIASGVLTVSKASRIAPVITPETQDVWIQKAATLTQKQIEKEVAKHNPKSLPREKLRALTEAHSELRIVVSKEFETLAKRAQEVLRTRNLEETLFYCLKNTLKQKDPVLRAQRNSTQKPKSSALRQVIPVAKEQGGPVPVSLKHLVSLRDQAKRGYQGCLETRYIEIHHIRPVSLGGKHELDNLITLCGPHHKMMHTAFRLDWTRGSSLAQ